MVILGFSEFSSVYKRKGQMFDTKVVSFLKTFVFVRYATFHRGYCLEAFFLPIFPTQTNKNTYTRISVVTLYHISPFCDLYAGS